MNDITDGSILYADSARGIYIPQYFAESVARERVEGITEEDWRILEAGPDHDEYWCAWDSAEAQAVVTAEDGTRYTVHQDGDLWLVPLAGEEAGR